MAHTLNGSSVDESAGDKATHSEVVERQTVRGLHGATARTTKTSVCRWDPEHGNEHE